MSILRERRKVQEAAFICETQETFAKKSRLFGKLNSSGVFFIFQQLFFHDSKSSEYNSTTLFRTFVAPASYRKLSFAEPVRTPIP